MDPVVAPKKIQIAPKLHQKSAFRSDTWIHRVTTISLFLHGGFMYERYKWFLHQQSRWMAHRGVTSDRFPYTFQWKSLTFHEFRVLKTLEFAINIFQDSAPQMIIERTI